MGNIRVRPMKREDIPDILAIERVSFPMPWSAASFQSEIGSPTSVALVIEFDDALAGYLCAATVLNETDVRVIAVAPALRRKSLARLLMLSLLNHAENENVQKIHLEVRRGNEAAIQLYESLGFSQVGVRKGYYQTPAEDAVLMTLEREPKN